MASQAVYCLSLQIRNPNANNDQNSASSDLTDTSNSTFHLRDANIKLANDKVTDQLCELNSNIILVRGTRTNSGQIILQNDNVRLQNVLSLQPMSDNLDNKIFNSEQNVLSNGAKLTPVLLQHRLKNPAKEGQILFQTLKRLDSTPPILLFRNRSEARAGLSVVKTEDDFQSAMGDSDGSDARHIQDTGKSSVPLGSDGEPIKLPDNLESLPRAEHFPTQRHRWNTNEEIAAILINFDRHADWQSKEVKIRPKSGSMLLYSRKKVRYRRDGYCWKKRKDGKTTREDHMKLKVQGTECIYGCYVHSAILPTFHRRCYWLLQNPDIVLVHYLNVPYPDDNKMAVITPSLALWGDKKEWTKDELVSQLKPMFFSEDEPDLNNELEISTAETVEAIVSQLMEKQRMARQAALVKQLECGCPDSTCADGKSCSHPMRRISAAKNSEIVNKISTGITMTTNTSVPTGSRQMNVESNNQVSSTTGSLLQTTSNQSPRVYSRDTRMANHHVANSSNASQFPPTSQGSAPPLVLSLSQIQGGGGLIILNSTSSNGQSHPVTNQSLVSPLDVTSFVCNNSSTQASQNNRNNKKEPKGLVMKEEAMDTNSISSCCVDSARTSRSRNHVKVENNNFNNGNISVLFDGLTYIRRDKALSYDSASDAKHTDVKRSQCDNKSQSFYSDASSVVCRSDGSSIMKGFFNETLDLSQEDIQRTLSANMPLCSSKLEQANNTDMNSMADSLRSKTNNDLEDDVIVSEMNPMDFIENCDVVVSPSHVDDDVFVNLDAFDMLGDFPDLEGLDATVRNSLFQIQGDLIGEITSDKNAAVLSPQMDFREGTASITDYSPEWAYPEGGVKVLVTGPWHSSTSPYTVLFDSFPVTTTLVQSGVLRCYCPAHEAGLATLQVACEGFVISNSVIFEYKQSPRDERAAPEPKVERVNENLFKFTLLQRLEAIDDKLQIKQEPEASDLVEDSSLFTSPNFEDRLVSYCQSLTLRTWRAEFSGGLFCSNKGMTLLHLASALGYCRLVCAMLHWRSENSSLLLDTEVDALSQDEEGYTPLMWACARGHNETATVLYRWNHTALNVRNKALQNPLDCAKSNSFVELANEIEHLENAREQSSTKSVVNISSSPSNSVISSRSHDGVFLRPGAVSSAHSPQAMEPRPFQRLIKRPSIDSGINMGSTDRPRGKPGRELPKLTRLDRSMSLPVSSSLTISAGLANHSPGTDSSDKSHSPLRRMDFALCEMSSERCGSPLIDVEAVSDEEEAQPSTSVGEPDVKVLTLAEQIIAAMPDRIKNESEDMLLGSPLCGGGFDASPPEPLADVFMEPLLDQQPSERFDHGEFNFEFSDHNYRYYDVGTPCSSLSPASSSCLQSPASFTLDSPSPPPTTQDHCDFLHASPFEADFSNITLSDREQRELYEAAKIIQKAYRSYKGRKKLEEQDKERAAAVLIQNYYRRYKQYAYFRQMTHAALVIQNGFRSYCEHKRFKKSQQAASCIQNYYRSYREQGRQGCSREGTPSGLKRTYSQRRQHQAARKIQQFMRQSKNKLQRERAERERQSAPLGYQDALQRSHSRAANLQLITAQNQCSEESSMAAEESISTDLHFWSDLL